MRSTMSIRPRKPYRVAFSAFSPVRSALYLTVAGVLAALFAGRALAIDEEAAEKLAKKGNCFKCHAINKRKKAPAYVEVAEKYRNRADAERVLYLHITGEPIVKLAEGDEAHAPPPSKDDSELYNLIGWILSLERRH